MKKPNIHTTQKVCYFCIALLLPAYSIARETIAVKSSSYFSNALFNTLLTVIVALAIMIVGLSSALKNTLASEFYIDKLKKTKRSGSVKTIAFLALMFINLQVFSQGVVTNANDGRVGGIDPTTFYLMVVTIGIEFLVLGILFSIFKRVIGSGAEAEKTQVVIKQPGKTILDKINDTVALEKEESILLDHEYDGIRELDNNLPPWWKYGFYLTVVVSIIYLINYHITKTSPLQKEEYLRSVKKAEAEIAEYMKNSANNVDETTVRLLTEASELTSGKDVFIASCAACHGRLGEGGVGPNLTDAYWMHGGSVKDIFKTIKYGWPDKGMKSWKEDLSPVQIAQITSFIRSLAGTNPPNAKDKQGDLYTEQALPADSLGIKTDSTQVIASERN